MSWNLTRGENLNLSASSTVANEVTKNSFEINIAPTSKKLSLGIDAAFRFFEQYKVGEVIARPQTIVRSGQLGRLQIGTDFGVYQRDFAGNLTTQFFSAGTIIEVTPIVYNQQGIDFISMTVDIQKSSLSGISPPILDKTEAKTKLLLLDGEETVIGGLYTNEETKTRLGIPYLKDLPWWFFGLRYIFGYDRDDVAKKELVILLKAELIPTLQDRAASRNVKENLIQEKLKEFRQDLKTRKTDKD
jgi:type IV pilus assembly protein PilQ